MDTFYAHGKLLLTGEYVVLTGAKSIALPTQLGQYLTIERNLNSTTHQWNSLDEENQSWFSLAIDPHTLEIIETNNTAVAQMLCDIIWSIRSMNPDFLIDPAVLTTKLEFNRAFGLGTSSTLISLLAQASGVNAFTLNDRSFKSSGYDIACALAKQPILYQRDHTETTQVQLPAIFKDHAYFIYLGNKQNSRDAVDQFEASRVSNPIRNEIEAINTQLLQAENIGKLEQLMARHEHVISNLIEQPTVQEIHFEDYWSVIKSLGAWGGDFVLALSDKGLDVTRAYFNSKGYATFYSYKQLILDE